MNDSFDELERDISRLPMPAVSEALDARVAESLRLSRESHHNTALELHQVVQAPIATWRWTAVQTSVLISLCVLSFVAGRYSDDALGSHAKRRPFIQPDQQQIAVVQVSLEPAAQSSFQELIGSGLSKETIWGSKTSLELNKSKKEEL